MLDNFFKDELASEELVNEYVARGYNDDTVPKINEQRNMGVFNYFTLWMGSIHNIPNYAAIGGFLFLGLAPINVMLAIILSSIVLSVFMVLNGRVGSKYGIPFSMHLRSVYGDVGAKLPGFLRGGVAAIAWFGLQNFTGSLALLVIIGNIWPGFLAIAPGVNLLGISVPGLISFTLFWGVNVLMGIGGGGTINKFTAILNPLIYIVFGGMTIWTLTQIGLGEILAYTPTNAAVSNTPLFLSFLMVINSVVAVWAGPGVSASDFTQSAKSTKEQSIGQTLSFLVGYGIFALCSVIILIGGTILYGNVGWDIVTIIENWNSVYLTSFAMLVLLMTTISTNATGNIIPAGYQLSALFPKKIDYKKGVIIASIISYVILPWKLMENADSIFIFLNIIGATLGPVAGVMLVDHFIVTKGKIDIDKLYMDEKEENLDNPYKGINKKAYIATIVGLILALSGMFIPTLKILSDISWFISLGSSGFIYWLLCRKEK